MKARKRFGQHFLDQFWVDRVVDAIQPAATDSFLEIGPGHGALTMALARRVGDLLAVEIDRDLAPKLATRAPSNVRVLEADFLQVPGDALLGSAGPIRVAGNLPYNISTPILFRLLALAGHGSRITDATVMLQREVADRLAADPGSGDWGVLSACQQLRATVRPLLALPPEAFRPPPRVHSAVVRVTYHPPDPAVADAGTFDALVRSIFLHRRKMLSNALSDFANARGSEAGRALRSADIDGRRRPETLSLTELGRLADVFASA
jgi:16S rRNA (adenine1518-N6/adenine1519-N6)-dimethyltransferase